ncbi:hypothetical protein ACLKA6_012942 [Drosophila palustris]
MSWIHFTLCTVLIAAVRPESGYRDQPFEWSPFGESHVNVPSGDRSGKIVVNGVCENCVTNRPIIGPTKQNKQPSKWSPYDESQANVPSWNLPSFFSFTKERVKRASGNISPNLIKASSNEVFSG